MRRIYIDQQHDETPDELTSGTRSSNPTTLENIPPKEGKPIRRQIANPQINLIQRQTTNIPTTINAPVTLIE
jgi:hypothetical protein